MEKFVNKSFDLPWIEKYRPPKTDGLLLNPFLLNKINKIIENRSIPNMILTGEPGTGKTSTILIITNEIFKEDYNEYVLELNASDDRGLSIINSTIIPFCQKKTSGNNKVVILDEADSITPKAQNLLSNIITEYKNSCRFVFICNDSTKINESIQSKCMIINYPKLPDGYIKEKILDICGKEKIKYTDEAVDKIIEISNNDIRKSINNMECIYHTFNKLDITSVNEMFDETKQDYIKKIIQLCINKKLKESLQIAEKMYKNGYNSNDIILSMLDLISNENDNFLSSDDRMELFKIISFNYIKVNEGNDNFLQLTGCVSDVYLYFINL